MNKDLSRSCLQSDCYKDFKKVERDYERGNIPPGHCSGTITNVLSNQHGAVFTVEGKHYIFKILGSRLENRTLSTGDWIDFMAIYDPTAEELFVLSIKNSGSQALAQSNPNDQMENLAMFGLFGLALLGLGLLFAGAPQSNKK